MSSGQGSRVTCCKQGFGSPHLGCRVVPRDGPTVSTPVKQKPGEPHARGVAAERSYPTSEVRGGGWEEQLHVQGAVAARVLEGLEELFHFQVREGRW